MNNNIFKSFRFEVVLYSLLSLVYSLLVISIIHIGYYRLLPQIGYRPINIPPVIMVIITVALGIVLFIVFFLLLTKKFVHCIREISEGINQISQGNLWYKISVNQKDEFGDLADKLNRMADDIKGIMENERLIECSKNELIASVAHDLRTPLTSIIGYLELVSAMELPMDTRKKYIGIAYSKSKRLEKLIEDLFTFTKFNFGEVKPVFAEVDIVKLLSQLIDEFYPSFKEFNLSYEFKLTCHSIIIEADGDLLARAFANLFSNAIKYGREGRKILIELRQQENDVQVCVTNYGETIPEEDLKQIFKRFYRVEASRSFETGGSGLGLAIAHSIIEMHEGNISAVSNEDGTVFTVILKRKLQTQIKPSTIL